ncbi:MAG: transglutaminase family protein [Pseudomonadota bacterium]|jgi:transglutaminase-like putative cysteine protease|nr:transglutaminase family protein [Pseudomonadota bacterium]HAG45414.1 transglutaminase family protein [Gammaproteobacteria bacterium]HIA86918.1 transglutaminase family protein [Gammaproteobacteria bacterium]HIC26423.1 transglutaminase family protein [Gammaproteobacteria bacterium]HIN17723.1 transglutaminase family protein [Gammaproteobacteria bacterium]|tara:strand:+ start:1291 stop:1905 length:615 start_codon:yes stop_codon:yes gene_type:complete
MSYVEDAVAGIEQDTKRAVAVYYAIRDGILYDPYSADISVAGLKATTVLKERRGWCVSKAILLAACCRALGIPARLGYADVLNHLSTEKMRQRMKTNVFYWHGYTALYLDERWVKATPAFNIELCEKFGLKPLEFNGRDDSIYHAFDQAGNRHMEYLHDRGQFLEPPIEAMRRTFDEYYPGWPDTSDATEVDFDGEVADETATR